MEVKTTKKTVNYIKYEADDFYIMVREGTAEALLEKIKKHSKSNQDSLELEWIQNKIRKQPKMVVDSEKYRESVSALLTSIFG